MADNVGYTEGSGKTIAADDIGGVLHQRVKVSVGADGAAADWEGSVSVSAGDNAIGRVKLTDGTDVADILDLASSNPLAVAIVDGSGSQITSFGGGTQYTEGDTDASITGTAMLMEVAADTLQPVQGTVADGLLVNLGSNNDVTVAGVATAANQTTIIGHVDGIEGLLTTIDADTGNLVTIETNTDFGTVTGGGTEASALRVTIANNSTGVLSVDDNGSTISIDDGGGAITVDGTVAISGTVTVDSELPTAAALADNTANPTVPAVGAFLMSYDGSTWDRTKGDSTDGLLVNLGTNNDVTVTGSVTANAGTNLNTSALALESGGNLAAAATSLSVLDDWDESDRCKTNTILKPTTSGGLTTYHLVSAGSTNASSVKASAGQLYGWYIYNSNAAMRKVAFHNTAGTPTAGTSVYFSLCIPAGSAANVFSETGMAFSTGIGITTVTGLADSDSAAVAANDLIINLWYA